MTKIQIKNYLELLEEYNILNKYLNNEKNIEIDFLLEFKYDIITKEEAKIRFDLLDFIIKNTKEIYEKI